MAREASGGNVMCVAVRKQLAGFLALLGLAAQVPVAAQTGQWLTFGHDAQRSGWAAEEYAFSPRSVRNLSLVWKTIVPNQPRALNGLTAPLIVRDVATPHGTRNLVIVAGSSDRVFALDAESGELVWRFDTTTTLKPQSREFWLCPNALNATPVIDPAGGRVFVITSDGSLRTLALADGHELIPRLLFVPPFSKMWSLNYSNGVLYTSLSQGCSGATSGIVALNPDSPGRPVTAFYAATGSGGGIFGRGGVSADFAGDVYGATGDGMFDPAANLFANSVVRLSPGTLQLAGYYVPQNWQYLNSHDLDMSTTTPVIFHWRNRVLMATGGKEGLVYLLDTTGLASNDHGTAAYVSPRYANRDQAFDKYGIWGEMSTWTDSDTVWLYVPAWGEPTNAVTFPASYGPVRSGSLMAFKLTADDRGEPVLSPAWISSDIAVPDPAAIAGGVVFVLGTGEDTTQIRGGLEKHTQFEKLQFQDVILDRGSTQTGHATLYALDARSGRKLWSSQNDITSWTHFSGLAVGDAKVLVSTHDGAVYAFGLPDKKAARPRIRDYSEPAPAAAVSPPAPSTAATPKCGAATARFLERCASCHDASGRSIAAVHTPDFTDRVWQLSKADAELLEAVKNGRTGGMPAFGDTLKAEEIDQLVRCVVRGFAPPTRGRVEDVPAVDGQQYTGAWAGTYESGARFGRFELAFQVGSDGKLAGGVSAASDQGDYGAQLTKVAFAGDKLTATYDYPPAADLEVSLEGTFDDKNASGTWLMTAKGQAAIPPLVAGTWKVGKK